MSLALEALGSLAENPRFSNSRPQEDIIGEPGR